MPRIFLLLFAALAFGQYGGNCLYFDGVDDMLSLDIPADINEDHIYIESWIKLHRDATGKCSIFSLGRNRDDGGADSTESFALAYYPDSGYFRIRDYAIDNTVQLDTNISYAREDLSDQWVWIQVDKYNDGVKLAIGEDFEENIFIGYFDPSIPENSKIYIGSWFGEEDGRFHGYMDRAGIRTNYSDSYFFDRYIELTSSTLTFITGFNFDEETFTGTFADVFGARDATSEGMDSTNILPSSFTYGAAYHSYYGAALPRCSYMQYKDTTITIEFWFKSDVWDTLEYIMSIPDSTNSRFIDLYARYDSIFFTYTDAEEFYLCQIPESTWAHIALIRDGERFRVFIDGIEYLDHIDEGFTFRYYSMFGLGSRSGYPPMMDFAADEMRIWDHARSQSQIIRNMCVSMDRQTPGLKFLARLDKRWTSGGIYDLIAQTASGPSLMSFSLDYQDQPYKVRCAYDTDDWNFGWTEGRPDSTCSASLGIGFMDAVISDDVHIRSLVIPDSTALSVTSGTVRIDNILHIPGSFTFAGDSLVIGGRLNSPECNLIVGGAGIVIEGGFEF